MTENQLKGSLDGGSPPEVIMRLDHVKMYFPLRGFVRASAWVRAVDGVSLEIKRGETLALVGESGCGKSTLAKLCVGLYAPTAGTVYFDGADMAKASGQERKRLRRSIQIVFQNPFTSLDPRMNILQILGEPMSVHGLARGEERTKVATGLLEKVGLRADHLRRYPHQFSGGQRQRIAIARALAAQPRMLILDEPTSSLDVSVQAQTLNLLSDLKEELGLTYLFISHDLSVVRHISDRIGVMYLGEIVELTSNDRIFDSPMHPYTQALLASIPGQTLKKERVRLVGDVPSAVNPPAGCRFNPRCPYAFDRCRTEPPKLQEVRPGHLVACHLYPK